MFRSHYHKNKFFIKKLPLLMVILLGVTILLALHTKIKSSKSSISTPGKHVDSGKRQNLETYRNVDTTLRTRNKSKSDNLSPPYEGENRRRRLPQAIIIGSRKSGTRALLKFLEINPAIRAARNEVHFFDRPQNYKLGNDWYRNQMPESTGDDITMEKTPAYFVKRHVPERVKAMNSSIKLVLIFRNPVTRLVSDYSQLVANKIEKAEKNLEIAGLEDDNDVSETDEYADERGTEYGAGYSPATGVNNTAEIIWNKAEQEFEKYVMRPDGGIDEQRRAIKIGMYSNYLERWRKHFPSTQFHFVDGEILITNPFEELHKLEIFLGLKPVARPESFVFNTRKGFYCISADEVNSLRQQQTSRDNSHESNKTAMKGSATIITGRPACLSKSKGRRHVAVRKELLERLAKFYEPYNEYLYSLTDRNFNWS